MIDSSPWAGRRHHGPPTVPLQLSAADRQELERKLGPGKVEKRIFLRGQALLLLADGVAPSDIAKLLGVSEGNVRKWKRRFRTDKPLERLVDAPRTGRPPSLSQRQTAPR